MTKISKKYLFVIAVLIILNYRANGQDKDSTNLSIDSLIENIETLISNSNFEKLNDLIMNDSFISLKNGATGYYSKNQSYYVLTDYFNLREIISFKYKNVSVNRRLPYVIGELEYFYSNKKVKAKIFISFKKDKNNWKIYQFTVN